MFSGAFSHSIFQLYRGGHFYWGEEAEIHRENKSTDKGYHINVYGVHPSLLGNATHNAKHDITFVLIA